MRVFVYWNLHRKVWSIKALEGPQRGRVVAHAHSTVIENATFKVSEAGRQRVLREQRKNVHAGVEGEWFANVVDWVRWGQMIDAGHVLRVSYNPYAGPSFTECETHKRVPVRSAYRVLMAPGRVHAWGPQ